MHLVACILYKFGAHALVFPRGHSQGASRSQELKGRLLLALSLLSLHLRSDPMACLLALIIAATVLTVQSEPCIAQNLPHKAEHHTVYNSYFADAFLFLDPQVPTGNKLANAARTSPAEAFWRTALPGSPMPESIRELLHTHPESTVLNDAKLKDDGDDPPPMSFKYDDYRAQKASPRNDAAAPTPEVLKHVAAGARNAATGGSNAAASSSPTVFFLEEAVRVGGSLPFRGVRRAPAVTDAPAMVTKNMQAPLRLLTVRAVRAVAEGSSFMVCRRRELRGPCDDEAVAYGCRATTTMGPARAYDVAGGHDAAVVMTAAVFCHADTSRWDPEHVAFRLLGVKPGGAAVCYAVPDAHVLAAGHDEGHASP
ncbi:hypothetical protein EJB05_43471 [Eragrostis curvula]|uniref:BURP domain-containing protein n=1 Tax=Eragrostis curvula TaxID=38414 RepID=A0A5J9TH19_9POAL|nr:hypothetical protein EJB05_43471 [Eragrostis curvula]